MTLIFIGGILLQHSAAAAAQSENEQASGDHVKLSWLAPDAFSRTQASRMGVYFEVDPGWHVYWRNPGDSGAAPRFEFESQDADVGQALWPAPSRLPIEHLTNLGYPGNVAYLFDVTPRADAQQLEIKLDIEWLVCKVDCIPGFGQMALQRPVKDGPSSWSRATQARVEQFVAQLPKQTPAQLSAISDRVRADYSSGQLHLSFPAAAPQLRTLFPLQGNFVNAAQPLKEPRDGKQTFVFKTLPGAQPPSDLDFIAADQNGDYWQLNNVPLRSAASVAQSPELKKSHELKKSPELSKPPRLSYSAVFLLLSAVLGGIVLNLMPCVFPVLSIKVMHLCDNHGSSARRLGQALAYSAGVITTFAALGIIFLLLRASGAAVGWGFQLQSPLVVLALIMLFWLMGLSFLGMLSFGDRLMQWAAQVRSGSSFLMGMLAVFVAAPCTGPFMGAALGATVVLSPILAMAIFICLGVGLALPYLLLAALPGLVNRLPAPGQWMETLRQFFAFPMFATAIWLSAVLSKLVGPQVWWLISSLMLLTAFALWGNGLSNQFARKSVLGFSVAAVAVLLVTQPLAERGEPTEQSDGWQEFSQRQVERSQALGRAVFIDFTAAWCITCQVNKQLVLNTDAANELFQRNNILRLRADWTRYDKKITEALSQFGRNSVPLYVYYPAGGGAAEILPQILTLQTLRETIAADSHHLSFQSEGFLP